MAALSSRDTMVLPGRDTVAIYWLSKSDGVSDRPRSLFNRPQADLVQHCTGADGPHDRLFLRASVSGVWPAAQFRR